MYKIGPSQAVHVQHPDDINGEDARERVHHLLEGRRIAVAAPEFKTQRHAHDDLVRYEPEAGVGGVAVVSG